MMGFAITNSYGYCNISSDPPNNGSMVNNPGLIDVGSAINNNGYDGEVNMKIDHYPIMGNGYWYISPLGVTKWRYDQIESSKGWVDARNNFWGTDGITGVLGYVYV